MVSLFNRKRKKPKLTGELARQLTVWDRKAAESLAPGGTISYATYDLMQSDSMIQTALTVKRLGVLAAPYSVVASGPSAAGERNARFVEACFAEMAGSPTAILAQAMDAFAKGWSVQEMLFAEEGGRIALTEVRAKNPATFGLRVDAFGKLTGLRLEVPGEPAQELPRGKFVVYANRGGYGRPKGRSDLDAAYPHYAAKSQLLDAWKLHLERFASPTMLGRFQRGISTDEQSAILAALNDLARSKAIVFPSEIEVSAIAGEREPSTGFMDAIEFHNREIARAILGQTLTTDEGRRVGSLALGKVHLQVLMLQLQSIREELADLVMTEQVIRPLIELNFGPGDIPRFVFEPTPLSAFTSVTV